MIQRRNPQRTHAVVHDLDYRGCGTAIGRSIRFSAETC